MRLAAPVPVLSLIVIVSPVTYFVSSCVAMTSDVSLSRSVSLSSAVVCLVMMTQCQSAECTVVAARDSVESAECGMRAYGSRLR